MNGGRRGAGDVGRATWGGRRTAGDVGRERRGGCLSVCAIHYDVWHVELVQLEHELEPYAALGSGGDSDDGRERPWHQAGRPPFGLQDRE
jgi:hypothetical protein